MSRLPASAGCDSSGLKPSAKMLPWISSTGSPAAPCTSYSRMVPLSSALCICWLLFHADYLQHFLYRGLAFAQQDGGISLQVQHTALERARGDHFRGSALRHQVAQLSVHLEDFVDAHA